MFKQLMITELEANREVLYLSLALNLILFFALGVYDADGSLNLFCGVTMLSYWVLLVVASANAGHEKRNRLYAQLPVTNTEAFLAGWLFVMGWLCLQASIWFLFGTVFTDSLTTPLIEGLLSLAINSAAFIVIISIGIDLGSFRPKYIQWIYVLFMAGLFAIAIIADATFEVDDTDLAFNSFPNMLLDRFNLGLEYSVLMVLALLGANYYVFRNSDSYLT